MINVDVKSAKSYNINFIATPIKYVSLETTQKSLISSISKLYVINDSILIFDSRNQYILLFDQKGKFIRTIGIRGKGPSEYIEFNDIYYDFDDKKLYAFERFLNKMFIYSLNGNLYKEIDSKFSFNSFIKDDNGFWIYSCFKRNNPKMYSLIYSDLNLETIKKGYFSQKAFVNITNETCFTEDTDRGKYFYFPSSNIIYKLENNDIKPILEVNFDNKTLPYKEIEKAVSIDDYDKIINSSSYVGFIHNLHIFGDNYVFNCNESQLNQTVKSFAVSVELDSSKVNVFDGYDNVPGSPTLSNLLYTTKNKELIYAINPSTLADREIEELKKIVPNIMFDSNPIIVFYKLR